MLPYMLMVFSVLTIPFFLSIKSSSRCYIDTKQISGEVSYRGYIFAFIILLAFSSFRGDFTQDYHQYIYNLNLYGGIEFNFAKLLNARQEILFVLLYWIIGFFPYKVLAFTFITSLIIETGFFRRFIKDSHIPWVCIMCFVLTAGYLTSFNMIRQMVSCAITLFAIDKLYEKKIIKYILIIIIAALVHTSALVMLIAIPVFYYRSSKLRDFIIFISCSCALYLFYKPIISLIQRYVFNAYTDYAYQEMAPIRITKILLISFILLYAIAFSNKRNYSDKEQFWYKMSVVCAIFLVGSLQVKNFERIAVYYYPYVCLLFSSAIYNQPRKTRFLLLFFFGVMSVIYMFVTIYGSPFDPYIFAAIE